MIRACPAKKTLLCVRSHPIAADSEGVSREPSSDPFRPCCFQTAAVTTDAMAEVNPKAYPLADAQLTITILDIVQQAAVRTIRASFFSGFRGVCIRHAAWIRSLKYR